MKISLKEGATNVIVGDTEPPNAKLTMEMVSKENAITAKFKDIMNQNVERRKEILKTVAIIRRTQQTHLQVLKQLRIQ
jgi:hypothetical protein